MRLLFLLLLVLVVSQPYDSLAQGDDQPAADRYTRIFYAPFSSKKELRQWDKRPRRKWIRVIKDDTGRSILRVRSSGKTRLLKTRLPPDLVSGRKLLVRLHLKASHIEGRTVSYNGVKVALHVAAPEGEGHPQLQIPENDLAWQAAGFTAVAPANATSCTLWVGLEDVSGEAFFDDVEVFVMSDGITASSPTTNSDSSAQRLRGAMIATNASAEDLRVLASWGAKHVRWQLNWDGFPDTPADTASLGTYMIWLRSKLAQMQSLMPLCDSLGLKVVIDLHTLPGGRRRNEAGQEHRIFFNKDIQHAFREIWREIALRFRNEPALWGYDLANEPIEGYLPNGVLDWQQLAQATATDILAIDSLHRIIMEGAPVDRLQALTGIIPLSNISKAVYSFHMYEPAVLTHQGIYGLDTGIRYPGKIGGRYWDKEALRMYMQPIRDWQLKHNASIYVGEFSAIRWAPDSSAYRYLRDCIDVFEEWGWHWAYHAFREWDGWSVEHDDDPANHNKASVITDRQQLLIESFRKNREH